MQNNTNEKKPFNVISTSIARTAGLRKLALVLQGGPEIRTVNFCLCSSMGNIFQMNLWNLQNERHRWRRILYVTTTTSTTTTSITPTKILSTCAKIHFARWHRIGWRLLCKQWKRWIRHQHFWQWKWQWWQWRWKVHLSTLSTEFWTRYMIWPTVNK